MPTYRDLPRHYAFILRLWETRSVPPDPSSHWRFSLEDVHTGEKHKFPDLESLDAFLHARMAAYASDTDQELAGASRRARAPDAEELADKLDPQLMGASLLLVEEDDTIRQWLRRWLEVTLPSCTITEVGSAETAVAQARSASPDVILVDVAPPGGAGLDIFGRLEAAAPAARLIALGTDEQDRTREEVLSAGAHAYVLMWRIRQELPRTVRDQLAAEREMEKDRTVVCIEDEPDMISLIELALQRIRVKLIGALGGAEGLDRIRQVKPDLVLLDLMMPDIDGWEVYRRMKADEGLRHIPIIVITAMDPLWTKKQGLDPEHVDGFIHKPFVPQELVQMVNSTLRLVA